MINYSIIIPHKNTPDLLRKCLDSIPQRADIQIIVVDDNSDAEKVNFEHIPGLGEPHTEVYLTKKSKGAGYARNVGLEHAIGKWVLFLDSDDFFHESISELMDMCSDMDADVIFYKADSVNITDGTDGHRGDEFSRRVDIAIKGDNFQPVLLYSSPIGKIIKFEFLSKNNIKFNEVRYSNDVVFMAKVALYSEKHKAIDLTAYCISVSKGTLTGIANPESCLIRLKQDIEGIKLLKKKYKLSRDEKFWYYYTWKGVYDTKIIKGFLYYPQMLNLLGFDFLQDSLTMFYKNIKHKVKSINNK
ncbi:MAG: glycosyltransferase family 2 protein [Bacteroidia bacterium]|nr:glycosyltransferase family 2 protein [Bacteroidia bacterium]